MTMDTERQPEPRLDLRGAAILLNDIEMPKVKNRRQAALMIVLVVAVLAQSLGIMRMLPLKERIPYVLRVEVDGQGKETGKVEVSESGVEAFRPTEANMRYFLGKWAVDLLTIDERTRQTRLPASMALMKGQGVKDWRDFVDKADKPLEILSKDPTFRRRAELISITFLTEETAMIRVKLTSSNGIERRVQLTLNIAQIPPATEADVYRNPIGLWILSFGVNNELA